MDSVALRQSHFQLGDEVNPYETTSMIQSNNIENAGPCNSALDEALKNDLRRHHFVFGNDNPNYNTEFRREYYDKSAFNPANQTDFNAIERKLKTQNFDLGNYKPDYLTETAEKYTKPQINPEDFNKVTMFLEHNLEIGTQLSEQVIPQKKQIIHYLQKI